MKIGIYIPTRGRVGKEKQKTLRAFLNNSSYLPKLICPKDEVEAHKRYYPNVVGCSKNGIGPTRQWIMEYSKADIVIVASDDLDFLWRPEPTDWHMKKCTELDPMLDLIHKTVAVGKFIHGGISQRKGNQVADLSSPRKGILRWGHVFVDNIRVNDFHFFNRKAVLATGARFDALPVMEDFHLTLDLLTRGHQNTVIYDYIWGQNASSLPGGCSLYRTPEVQTKAAHALQKRFPDFVKVVTKKSKATSLYWKDMKERTDVRIQWLKAYKSSQS